MTNERNSKHRMAQSLHATRIKIFKNGDKYSTGRDIVVSQRYFRTFEAVLDDATRYAKCSEAVQRLYTPGGGHTVTKVEELQNGGRYVAVGRQPFKKMDYGVTKSRVRQVKLPPIQRTLATSGRARKVYEGEKLALKRIKVYCNGRPFTPPRSIILKRDVLLGMGTVLAAVQDSSIECNFPISKLYTREGKQVLEPSSIQDHEAYVAVERGSRFIHLDYGHFGRSPRTMHFTKSPQIPSYDLGGATTGGYRSPKKLYKAPTQPSKPKPVVRRPKEQKRPPPESNNETRSSLSEQSRFIRSIHTQESFPNITLSATPPKLDAESPDFTLPSLSTVTKVANDSVFSRIPEAESTSQKRTEVTEIPSNIDELDESEQTSIAQKLYQASGMQKEWGDMIADDKKTTVEKLIDDVPAEEVDEEIMETAEENNENSEKTLEERIRETIQEGKEIVEEKVEEKQGVLLGNLRDETETEEEIEEVALTATEGGVLGGDGNQGVLKNDSHDNKPEGNRNPSPANETRQAFEEKEKQKDRSPSPFNETRQAFEEKEKSPSPIPVRNTQEKVTSPIANVESADALSPQSDEVTLPRSNSSPDPESDDSPPEPESEENAYSEKESENEGNSDETPGEKAESSTKNDSKKDQDNAKEVNTGNSADKHSVQQEGENSNENKAKHTSQSNGGVKTGADGTTPSQESYFS